LQIRREIAEVKAKLPKGDTHMANKKGAKKSTGLKKGKKLERTLPLRRS
jgi:hypothetical protein